MQTVGIRAVAIMGAVSEMLRLREGAACVVIWKEPQPVERVERSETYHLRAAQLMGVAEFIIGPAERPDPLAPVHSALLCPR